MLTWLVLLVGRLIWVARRSAILLISVFECIKDKKGEGGLWSEFYGTCAMIEGLCFISEK
jgi:hypothetical protein